MDNFVENGLGYSLDIICGAGEFRVVDETKNYCCSVNETTLEDHGFPENTKCFYCSEKGKCEYRGK